MVVIATFFTLVRAALYVGIALEMLVIFGVLVAAGLQGKL